MVKALIPAVSVALRNKNRFLLVQRGREPSRGYWAFPGGRVETGETLVAAIRRELLEETGLDIHAFALFQTLELDGEWGEFLLHVFSAETTETAVRASDDAADAGWFTVSEMTRLNVTPSTIEFAQLILDGAPSTGHADGRA